MMSDVRRLASGVVMAGLPGVTLDASTERVLRRENFGGIVLFSRNGTSVRGVRALTDALRACADPAALIAIDQEGGRVARLTHGITVLPSMMALGAVGDVSLARRAGEQLGFDLRRAGCSLDFAPVLDLALVADNTVIGTRSLGSSVDRVASMGIALAEGLVSAGITPTFKHFPGHGSTDVDSHRALPHITIDERTLRARDMEVFRRACRTVHGAALMTAHVVAEALDAHEPATLSRAVLTDLLRDEWGFDGACFTDCMQMDAIATSVGTVEGVVRAIAAGADCAVVSQDLELAVAAVDRLVEAVSTGVIPRSRLHEAYDRVRRLRETMPPPLPLDAIAPHPGIGREIARGAVTLIRGIAHADPTAAIVVSFESETDEGAQGTHRHHASLCAQAPALLETIAPLCPSDADVARLLDAVTASGRRALVLARRAHIYRAQSDAIDRLIAQQPDALVVSMREPFDLPLFWRARHLVATYGDDEASVSGLADVLFGGAMPQGTLPVAL